MIEEFVRCMISGCALSVASKNGKQQVTVLLDADLKVLTVRATDGSKKPIPLAAREERWWLSHGKKRVEVLERIGEVQKWKLHDMAPEHTRTVGIIRGLSPLY